jgi:hypothetical protein
VADWDGSRDVMGDGGVCRLPRAGGEVASAAPRAARGRTGTGLRLPVLVRGMLVVRIGEYKVDGRKMDGIFWVGDCCRRGRKGKERKGKPGKGRLNGTGRK